MAYDLTDDLIASQATRPHGLIWFENSLTYELPISWSDLTWKLIDSWATDMVWSGLKTV